MEKSPAVVWDGSYDDKLYELITIFASADLEERSELPGPYARSLFFDKHTVETLCNAAIRAEDAVACRDAAGEDTFRPTAILTETENEQIFGTEHSPFYGPLVGLANIARDYPKSRGLDSGVYIYQPLKKYWSRMIRQLWDHPARSLGAHDMFQRERYLVPFIFCRIVEAERSFASVIDDESDLTIALITRYWVHATGEEEIVQLFIFLMILIPMRSVPGNQNGLLPLYTVAEGETDTTITVLRRILRNNATIAEFVGATASHLRRFRGFEAKNAAALLEKLWNWARSFRSDPLCSEFHRVIRTSAPLWSSLFEASSRSTDDHPGSFMDTQQFYMSNLANHLIITRESPSDAIALTELWVSTGIFDAMEASLREVVRCGTEDEQVEFCRNLARIYHGISYGPQGNPAFTSLMQQQLPRPRTIRLLWDISVRLSGNDVNQVAPSHACRIVVLALEQMFTIPNACNRRGCARISTARCTRCRLEYCGTECQKRDWKYHKLVCGIRMDMEPAVRDAAYRVTRSWTGH